MEHFILMDSGDMGKMFVPSIEVNQFHILHGCQQSVTKDILQAVDFLAGLAVKDQGR